MKRNLISPLIIIIIAASILVLTVCSCNRHTTALSPPATPSASPYITYAVKSDYSKLTPYEPMEELYTRLSEGDMPELVPSEDYGMLLPYTGSWIYSQYLGSGLCEGLITSAGMIVTDAVYSRIYQPSDYDDSTDTDAQSPLYILDIPVPITIENEHYAQRMSAVCAQDGSWVTPFDYQEVICCDKVMLLFRDGEINDFDVMDYSGKLLYNSKALDFFAQLKDYHFYRSDGPGDMNYGDGYITLRNDDERCLYFDEMSGKLINTDFSNYSIFSNGLAAVEIDGLWGYIDTDFSFVIDPIYVYAGYFYDGKAVVVLPNGENAVINMDGFILFSTKSSIAYRNDCFIVTSTQNNETTIYNSRLEEVFNSSAVASWHEYNGYFSYIDNTMTTIIYNDLVISYPGEYDVYWIDNGCIFLGNAHSNAYKLMTLQGIVIADFDQCYSNGSVVDMPDGLDIAVMYNDDYNFEYDNDAYLILNTNGTIISEGRGQAYPIQGAALFKINTDRFFGYMDTSGKYIFKLSLLDSLPD